MIKLLEYIKINDYFIDKLDNKQLAYNLIYNLGQKKLKLLKIYIKDNLTSGLIRTFKFYTSTLIKFIHKKISNFCLYIDY